MTRGSKNSEGSKTKEIKIKDEIRKIIYIDQETIENSNLISSGGIVKEESTETINGKIEAGGEFNLGLSLINKIKFVFSSDFRAYYLNSYTKTRIKQNINFFIDNIDNDKYTVFDNIEIADIQNSFSSIRALTPFVKVMNSDEEYDYKAFDQVFKEVEGYETYIVKDSENCSVKEKTYLRFNNEAFISNYKRMEIINSKISCVAVYVGKIDRDKFEFTYIMDNLGYNANTLSNFIEKKIGNPKEEEEKVEVYDVIISYIPKEKEKK